MNSTVTKLVSIVLAVLLLSYIGVQVFTSLYNPYQTETVKIKTYSNNIQLDGFFVRDETVLPQKKSGVINYKYLNGEKIPKQAVIANVYNLESDLYNIKKVEQLKNEKAVFEELKNSQSVEGSKLDLLTNQVNLNQLELVRQVESGDFQTINKTKENFIYNLNKIEMSIDNTIDFQQHITDIDSEIQNIQASISPSNDPIVSENSGYFSSTVDGYEDQFDFSMLNDLSVKTVQDTIKKAKSKKTNSSNSIGKIQSNADWYFVALIDTIHLENIKEGQSIPLVFNSKTSKSVSTTVSDIVTTKGSEKSVLVLYSNYIDEDFISMRFEKPQAVLGDHEGVVVPKEAIRVSNIQKTIVDEETGKKSVVSESVKGVYTLLGKTVRFKELDVVYEDMYVVVSRQNTKSNYVSVYDKVIIKGKDLNESE